MFGGGCWLNHCGCMYIPQGCSLVKKRFLSELDNIFILLISIDPAARDGRIERMYHVIPTEVFRTVHSAPIRYGPYFIFISFHLFS